jgi:hypothetical protein
LVCSIATSTCNIGSWNAYVTKKVWFFMSFPFIRKPILFRTRQKNIKLLITLIFYHRAIVKQGHYMKNFLSYSNTMLWCSCWKIPRFVALPFVLFKVMEYVAQLVILHVPLPASFTEKPFLFLKCLKAYVSKYCTMKTFYPFQV